MFVQSHRENERRTDSDEDFDRVLFQRRVDCKNDMLMYYSKIN